MLVRIWFFTALTRATYFNKIKFFKYNEGQESKSKRIVEQYFERKVFNYIEQDKKAGRDVEGNDYVDVDFLMNLMNTQCENCNEPLVIDFEDGRISSNITRQRVNCCEAHFKDNCKGYCVSCNCALSNKNIIINIMADNKQKIISDIYFDRSGYGKQGYYFKRCQRERTDNKNVRC